MIALISFSVIAYAEENPTESTTTSSESIVTTADKALVGNGTPGVAVVASYNDDGSLKSIVSKPVTADDIAILDVSVGDKIMYFDSLETLRPIVPSVTVIDETLNKDKNAIYEAAVEQALVEALGKDKGKNFTELQKALALHDWLINNCMYDLEYFDESAFTKYGAIVNHIAVCSGYAAAYADLLGRAGIKAYVVSGISPTGDPHAWNCLRINGKYYYADVAAGDTNIDVLGGGRYAFFLLDAASWARTGYEFVDDDNCTDTTFNNYSLFRDGGFPLIYDEDKQIYYYADIDVIKTTTSAFDAKLSEVTNETGLRQVSMIMSKDKRFIYFLKPSFQTRYGTVYLYSIETDEYYTYDIEDVSFYVIFCGLRENGKNLEVTRSCYIDRKYTHRTMITIPLPTSLDKRFVTFDDNYEGGTTKSCYYLDNYWKDGDGSFAVPDRKDVDFRGWYTEKDGGTKIEHFEDIPEGCTTLYAHWWGDWTIAVEPTLTETGKAERPLETNSKIKDEFELPTLSDTTFWKVSRLEPTSTHEGNITYYSSYGRVVIKLPKKFDYAITRDKNGGSWGYWITYAEAGTYYQIQDIDGEEVISEKTHATWMVTIDGPCKAATTIHKKLKDKTGTLTIKLYNSDWELLCQASFEVE